MDKTNKFLAIIAIVVWACGVYYMFSKVGQDVQPKTNLVEINEQLLRTNERLLKLNEVLLKECK